MIILGGKRHIFLFFPCVLHGFAHPGKILRHLRWMQEQTSLERMKNCLQQREHVFILKGHLVVIDSLFLDTGIFDTITSYYCTNIVTIDIDIAIYIASASAAKQTEDVDRAHSSVLSQTTHRASVIRPT